MGEGGYCTKCPGKCHWSKHHNKNYYFETRGVKKTKTLEELKAKYDKGIQGLSDAEK